ncbi:alpha/beta hydrolase [Brachybacterium ginsengisoli]|uniref:Alpha/beta hydrolase n=1 Tax=Brachybacterium ginsengisoli TaxID=1331682 RepID=A0A291GVY7_9MICO|nr:alpha/beta hydrolase [Brachybacterium ginsengisoli]ATG54369.1 alpha/beta hydrolase [Brachybacterium ginsengisoli]
MGDTARTLALLDADIAHHVRGALPPDGGDPVLLMIGQPMTSEGFSDLAEQLPERTVVTYDPRGLGESTRRDDSALNDPVLQAEDLHALVEHLGGPVDLFASSGGAVAGLALLTAHPEDIRLLVAHEPPLFGLLPDAEAVAAVNQAVTERYHERGWGAGLAAFIVMSSWQGELTEEVSAQFPAPEQFGLPAADDGRRDDPLLSGASAPVTDYVPDLEALRAQSGKLVLGLGEQTGQAITARSTAALAERLGVTTTSFPGDHGGFHAGDPSNPGDPAAFAERLREVFAGGR